MNNRFPNNQNQIGSRLLANVDSITIHADKSDDGVCVRYQLSGGVNFDMEPGDEKQAIGFVREILDAFERS